MTTTRTALLVATLSVAACQTTTTTTRSESAVRETKLLGQDWQPDGGRVYVAGADKVAHVVVRAIRVEKCTERLQDMMVTTVTNTTVVDQKDKEKVGSLQQAGGVVLGIGLAGLALTPVTLFDPHAQATDKSFIPVAEQPGTALWPVGLGIAAVGVALGAPLLAAPLFVGMQEGVVAVDEVRTIERAEQRPDCRRDVPAAGERVEAEFGAIRIVVGQTDATGAAILNLNDVVTRMVKGGNATATLELMPSERVLRITGVHGDPGEPTHITAMVVASASTGTQAIAMLDPEVLAAWNLEADRQRSAGRSRDLAQLMTGACSETPKGAIDPRACVSKIEDWVGLDRNGIADDAFGLADDVIDTMCEAISAITEDNVDGGKVLAVCAFCKAAQVRLAASRVRACRTSCKGVKSCGCTAPANARWVAAGRGATAAAEVAAKRGTPAKALTSASAFHAFLSDAESKRKAEADQAHAEAERNTPKDPKALRLVAVMKGDVYAYFGLNEADTPLMKKNFEASEEYRAKQAELVGLQGQMRAQLFEVEVAREFGNYDLSTRSFHVDIGGNVGTADELYDWAPKTARGFNLEELPTVRWRSPLLPSDTYREQVHVDVDEKLAGRMEGRKMTLVARFTPQGTREMTWECFRLARIGNEWFTRRGTVIVADLVQLLARDDETGEVYWSRQF
ncbi:MAG: hypothetical protein Q8O67_17115 [Deltaproteobacteria bacterium]|nr:hypothetical protein [Deltaproteobacteria bacterium]